MLLLLPRVLKRNEGLAWRRQWEARWGGSHSGFRNPRGTFPEVWVGARSSCPHPESEVPVILIPGH